MRNITTNLQNSDVWKIQLTIVINLIFSKDSEEEPVLHSDSCTIKLMPYSDANDVIETLFKSLFSKYQENLETSMKGRNFIFDSFQLLYYKCHKVKFIRDGSYIDSSDCIKLKKATINPNKYRR